MARALPLLVCAATVWLGYEFWRLLFQPVPAGAVDLLDRRGEVLSWFRGEQVYLSDGDGYRWAVYPPATYLMLWPALGWLPETAVRWLWAALTIAALVPLSLVSASAVGARTPAERRFLLCLPLAIYPTGACIGNGQLTIHVVLALIVGICALERQRDTVRDLVAAGCVLMALVKPTVAVPFFWILAFRAGSLRPAVGVVAAYVAFTLVAAAFQPEDLTTLIQSWIHRGVQGVAYGSANDGYSNQSSWLGAVGRADLNAPASVAVLCGLGVWVFRQRSKDLWLLLGVCAIVARLWVYHHWYDDLLLLLPMIALLRIACGTSALCVRPAWAGPLAATMLVTLVAPGGLYLFPEPWNELYVLAQLATWLTVLVYLGACTIATPAYSQISASRTA
jgi:hypothetical protein